MCKLFRAPAVLRKDLIFAQYRRFPCMCLSGAHFLSDCLSEARSESIVGTMNKELAEYSVKHVHQVNDILESKEFVIDLEDIKVAKYRITDYIRHTPLVEARSIKQPICQVQALYLKLENLQVSGSFKARGAVNKLFSLSEEQRARGLVTASGGNHALGVAYAGWLASVPVTVYLPKSTPAAKAQTLENWGARVIIAGSVWDEANQAALQAAEREGLNYVHPFADPAVIAGQGTLGLEILADAPDIDRLLVAIGGGGLISGVSLAALGLKPGIKIIGVEPVGAPTLHESMHAGKLVELPQITTAAGTLAPRRSAAINLEIIQKNVDDIVLVTDEEMREAARWLWFEMGVAAELSGAAAIAALLSGKASPEPSEKVCALICGAGVDGIH